MKKLSISAIAMVLSAIVFILSGCEMSIDLNKEESTTLEPDTIVVEVTDNSGSVVATENVTMSQQEKKKTESFYKADTKKEPEKGVSQDRLQQALKQEAEAENNEGNTVKPVSGKKDTTKTTKPSNSSGKTENNNATSKPSENNGNSSNTTTTRKPSLFLDDSEILRSSQYTVEVRIVVDGVVTPYKIACKNNKTAMAFPYEGKNMGVIISEQNLYMLSMDEKEYIEIPKSMVEENITEEEKELIYANPFEIEREVKKTTTEKIDGVKYNVVVYESGAKDYMVGKTLIMTKATDGSVLYYDSVSPIASSSLFSPPKDFKRAELETTTAAQ